MEQIQLTQYVGLGVIAVIALVAIITAYNTGHAKGLQAGINTGSEFVEKAFNNPVYLQLAKGAVEGVPQTTFDRYLSTSQAVQAYTPDWVDAVLQRLDNVVKKIDHDAANDPATPPPAEESALPPKG